MESVGRANKRSSRARSMKTTGRCSTHRPTRHSSWIRDGIIRDLNRQALSMFGWSREEMLGSPVERLVPKANSRGHREHRLRYNAAPRARPMGVGLELLALRSDGSTFPVEISLSPWKLASGGEHVICAVRDITQWKRIRRLSRVMVTAAENERKTPVTRAARRIPPVSGGPQDPGEALGSGGGRGGTGAVKGC